MSTPEVGDFRTCWSVLSDSRKKCNPYRDGSFKEPSISYENGDSDAGSMLEMRLLRNDLTCYGKALIAIRGLYLLHGPLHRYGHGGDRPHRIELTAEISGDRIWLRIEWSEAVIGSEEERSRAEKELIDQWQRNAFKDANQARPTLGLADKPIRDIFESQKDQIDDLVKETANNGLGEGPHMNLMGLCSGSAPSDSMLQVLRNVELRIKMVTKEVVAIHEFVKSRGKGQIKNVPNDKNLEARSEKAQAADKMQSTPHPNCAVPGNPFPENFTEKIEDTNSDSGFTEVNNETPDIESVDSNSAHSTHSGDNDSMPELVGGDDFDSKVDHLETDGW